MGDGWRRVSGTIDRVNDWIGALIRWLTLGMVAVGAYNALARWATRYADVALTSNALNELQWYFFSLVFLFGAAYGLNHDVHVRVDVLYSALSRRARAWIDLFGSILFLLPFCVLMLWVSFPAVRYSWNTREVSPDPGGLPRYPIKAVILICFVLLLLQGVSQIIKKVYVIRTGERWGEDQGLRAEIEGHARMLAEEAGAGRDGEGG